MIGTLTKCTSITELMRTVRPWKQFYNMYKSNINRHKKAKKTGKAGKAVDYTVTVLNSICTQKSVYFRLTNLNALIENDTGGKRYFLSPLTALEIKATISELITDKHIVPIYPTAQVYKVISPELLQYLPQPTIAELTEVRSLMPPPMLEEYQSFVNDGYTWVKGDRFIKNNVPYRTDYLNGENLIIDWPPIPAGNGGRIVAAWLEWLSAIKNKFTTTLGEGRYWEQKALMDLVDVSVKPEHVDYIETLKKLIATGYAIKTKLETMKLNVKVLTKAISEFERKLNEYTQV